MRKQKIGKTPDVPREESPIIVFGTQRIGAIYALRNGLNPKRIRLATHGEHHLQGFSGGTITVVRVSEEVWKPSTHPCELRTKETEQALKALEAAGTTINTVLLD